MANYRTFGKLDDPHVSDGDRGFQRMISRVNPELLEAGNVHYSQNGRMDQDYTWQPRKGMTVFFQAFQTQDVDTVLPFNLDSNPILNDNAVTGVYGTGSFVDLSDEQEYFAIALNNRVVAKPTDGSSAVYNIAYPQNLFVTQNVEFTMVNDKIILFREDNTALEFNTNLAANRPISNITISGGTATVTTTTSHGLTAGDFVGIFNVEKIGDFTQGTYEVESVVSTTEFTVSTNAANADEDQIGAIATINVFSFVPSGDYTAISVDNDVNMNVSEGVCTITATGHGRSTGDILQVYASSKEELLVGDRYEITVGDIDGNDPENKYHFTANVSDGNNFTVTLGGKQPVSGGFIHMPNPTWGVYHEGRLIVPYKRSKDIGNNIDELVFSDIFDSNTYDPIINQLRFGSGSADRIVGVSPFISDRLLVFCRRSVHVVNGISGELEDLSKFEVTREVGCIARKSITPIGNQIFWLSDQGIYSVSYGAELNLMSNQVPLSEPIEPLIRQINWEQAHKAIGVYNDNRFYLAVPFGNSVENNIIFVYNFLNKGWESVDTLPENFYIANMISTFYQGKNRLFLINDSGAVHLYENQLLGGGDSYSLSNNAGTFIATVKGKLVTRRYTFGTTDIKKFAKATAVADTIRDSFLEFGPIQNGSNTTRGGRLKISCNIKEPDSSFQLGLLDHPSGYFVGENEGTENQSDGDTLIKANINKRGYGLQFVYETSNTKVRSAQVDAFVLGRSTIIRS